MKTINGTTKKGRKMTIDYYSAKYIRICQVYQTYSQAKRREEIRCIERMVKEGGKDFRIISWNTFQFTCGWMLPNGDIRIETAQSNYLIKKPELPF